MSLDSFDHAILAIVRRDNQVTHQALGRQIGLSASSCRRRLAALRKSGTITADISVIDPRRIGLHVTLHALVTLDRDTTESHRVFRAIVDTTDAIVACTYVTGPADYVLTIHAEGIDRYEALTDGLMRDAPVKHIQTMVEMRTIKRI